MNHRGNIHGAWISELFLIFGAVNLGVAWSATGVSSPAYYLTGIGAVFISVILKYRAGVYKD